MLVRVSSRRTMTYMANHNEISVNENEYSLLVLLSTKTVLSKSEVVDSVWGSRGIVVTDSSYYQLLYSLRRKLIYIGLRGALRTLPRRGLQALFRIELVDLMPVSVS